MSDLYDLGDVRRLTARIEALEARGYVLHKNDEFAKAGEWFPWDDRLDESLTALEQAQARLKQAQKNTEGLADYIRECVTECHKAETIGRARLGIAERELRNSAAREGLILMRAELAEGLEEAHKESIRRNVQRAEQAEAALAAEREKQARRLNDPKKGEWKRKYFQSRAALDAERAKRCVHAVASTCPFYFAESTSSNQVPNVAQQGSERDAEGTGEASE